MATMKPPIVHNIPLSEPFLKGNEWQYLKDCIDSGWISTNGSLIKKFEDSIAKIVNRKYAIATTNGTSALHISLVALGIQPCEEIIAPTLTFIAPINAISYCRATPVFMDCDPKTLCLDVEKLSAFIKSQTIQKKDGGTYNKLTGKRLRAIIPVHIFGHPVDMNPLLEICEKKNIIVIEDACESLGSTYNKRLAIKIRHLSTQAKISHNEYDHDEIGYNYRLSNINAAIGLAQIEQLDEFIKIKRRIASIYKKELSQINSEILWEMPWAKSNFWLNTLITSSKHKVNILNQLLSKKIQARPIWKPIHTLPMYQHCQSFKIENAQKLYASAI